MTDPLHIERCTTCGEAINILDGGWLQSRETGRYWHTGCGLPKTETPVSLWATDPRLAKISQPQTD